MAMQSLRTIIKNVLAFMDGGVYDKLGRNSTWSAGQVLRVNPDQTIGSVPALSFITVASTDADVTNAKGAGFNAIFSTWGRISYNAGNPHAVPSEETSWSFDANTGKVTCGINSTTVTGFVGPDYYDRYNMEVVISSTDADDDIIGLVLAYQVDADGKAYALVAYRSAGSTFKPGFYYFSVMYNPDPMATGTGEWQVGGTNGSLHYPDGTAMPSAPTVTNGLNGGWDALGEISLKVERTPEQIKIWSSDKGKVGVYTDDNLITIDLTSDDRLTRFMHPSRIGYQAMSQPNATFRVLSQPDYQVPIFDVRDGSMQVFEGGAWKTYAAGSDYVKARLPQGITVSSIANNTLWYATYDGTLRKIAG